MKTLNYLNPLVLISIAGILSLVGCSKKDQPLMSPDSDRSIERQARIDELTAILSTVYLPQFFNPDPESEVVKDESWFDISESFGVLGGLSTEPGYVLDYVYFYNGGIGQPILYHRQAQTPAFRTFSELRQAVGDIGLWRMWRLHLDHLVIDEANDGYFDFAVQRLIGSQFYLHFHAIYLDTKIICTKTALESVLTVIENHSIDIKPDARKLVLDPTVTIEDDQVVVSLVTFTKWGGFFRHTFTIKREFPHEILQEDKTLLLEYDCGWVV